MTKLLVPVDGSENAQRALRYAIDLATQVPACEIVLMNVQPTIRSDPRLARIVTPAMIAEWQQGQHDAAIASARRTLDASGIRYTLCLERGAIAPAIVRIAQQHGCDQVVMGTRGAGALSEIVMGSVARQVANAAPVPVTLLH